MLDKSSDGQYISALIGAVIKEHENPCEPCNPEYACEVVDALNIAHRMYLELLNQGRDTALIRAARELRPMINGQNQPSYRGAKIWALGLAAEYGALSRLRKDMCIELIEFGLCEG